MQGGQSQLVQRSPPPKFRPFMIIVVVLSLGLLFIGLTLTIIAHWPGYTAIGFNPLKIVGPVLLAVGGVVFIGCIAEVIRKSQSDKKNFTRQMQERERMMTFINRTQSQASLGRSVQYAPVPQQPPIMPPQSQGDLYYAGGQYPPPQGQYPPEGNYAEPQGRYAPEGGRYPPGGSMYPQGSHPYPQGPPGMMSAASEDDVFLATSSRANSLVRSGGLEDPMYDSVDAQGEWGGPEGGQGREGADGAVIPEPMRPPARPETEAERARRERRDRKKRQKEMQSASSQASHG